MTPAADRNGCEKLSRRQAEIAGLICRELCDKQIGERLGLSSRTVNFYVRLICKKLGTRTRVGVAVRWTRYGKNAVFENLKSGLISEH